MLIPAGKKRKTTLDINVTVSNEKETEITDRATIEDGSRIYNDLYAFSAMSCEIYAYLFCYLKFILAK
jgi:hypothetical protein